MWGPNARVNKKFMATLANAFGQTEFTSKSAEVLYVMHHEKSVWTDEYHTWPRSTARQNLSIATERGILIRVRRGVYKFNHERRIMKRTTSYTWNPAHQINGEYRHCFEVFFSEDVSEIGHENVEALAMDNSPINWNLVSSFTTEWKSHRELWILYNLTVEPEEVLTETLTTGEEHLI